MPQLISLTTHSDDRGKLTVIEKDLNFEIARVFYIYDSNQVRGGHGHFKTKMALIAISGRIEVSGQSPTVDFKYDLISPSQALLLDPQDWHEMKLSEGSILLVLASHPYLKEDYFFKRYRP